jgi:ABC-type sugar transport system substrate-binding protein
MYTASLKDCGIAVTALNITSWNYEDARAEVSKLLSESSHTTWDYDVIAAANDAMGLGAADALDEYCWKHHLRLKKRAPVLGTKVVGFDGLPSAVARLTRPESRFIATLAAGPRQIVDTVFTALCEDVWHADNAVVDVSLEERPLKTTENPSGHPADDES